MSQLTVPSSTGIFRSRDQLGDVRFEALATEGRAMAMEQAIEYALEISTRS
jgi:hypothetical protein